MEHTNVDMNCESCINDSGLDMDVLFDLPNLLDFTFKPDQAGFDVSTKPCSINESTFTIFV